MKELFESFTQALKRLEEILNAEKSIINRDAAILRFEFTVELAWKCIQKFLRGQEIVCRSPKECLKEAFGFGLVKDDARWLSAFQDRNLLVHAYTEEDAETVYGHLPNYLEIFKELKSNLNKRIK